MTDIEELHCGNQSKKEIGFQEIRFLEWLEISMFVLIKEHKNRLSKCYVGFIASCGL